MILSVMMRRMRKGIGLHHNMRLGHACNSSSSTQSLIAAAGRPGSSPWGKGLPLRSLRTSAAAVLTAAFIILLEPALSFARAGGGEGYSGGGGGGGGGGGHGGGGGGGLIWILFELIRLAIVYPCFGVPLLIAIIIGCIYLYRNSDTPAGPAGGPGGGFAVPGMPQAGLNPAERQNAIAGIIDHDPAFNERAFYGRVNIAFAKIQGAWCMQKLTDVRPFISDGVHERFTLQFAEQKAAGWRDQLDNIQVFDIAAAEVRSDGLFDELSVRIVASASDYHVSLATNQPMRRPPPPERFVEIWSFLRRRGAVTREQPGLIEGNCPNCGAPVELNQSANCTHCKALLRSGQYDWVLSEITQEVEWQGARHNRTPGVDALRTRDSDFNAVEMEDRASVMFWRKATADRTGKIDALHKIASEAFCQAYAPVLRPNDQGQRQTFADCAVGSVQLHGVIPSATAGDRAIVEIRWSGKRVLLAANQPPTILEEGHLSHSLFVLWRQPGVKTDAGKGVSSAHCPGCGAPVSDSATSACEFCGVVLNDGSQGWILTDIANRNDARGQTLLQELASQA